MSRSTLPFVERTRLWNALGAFRKRVRSTNGSGTLPFAERAQCIPHDNGCVLQTGAFRFRLWNAPVCGTHPFVECIGRVPQTRAFRFRLWNAPVWKLCTTWTGCGDGHAHAPGNKNAKVPLLRGGPTKNVNGQRTCIMTWAREPPATTFHSMRGHHFPSKG